MTPEDIKAKAEKKYPTYRPILNDRGYCESCNELPVFCSCGIHIGDLRKGYSDCLTDNKVEEMLEVLKEVRDLKNFDNNLAGRVYKIQDKITALLTENKGG